jgi:hypothetical protein
MIHVHSVNGSSMAGNAGGTQTDGTQVLVVGGGFNTNGGYSCRFETDSTSLWTSAHVSAVDLLVCDVPDVCVCVCVCVCVYVLVCIVV